MELERCCVLHPRAGQCFDHAPVLMRSDYCATTSVAPSPGRPASDRMRPASPASPVQLVRQVFVPSPQSVTLPAQSVMSHVLSGAHFTVHCAKPLHEIVQSPSQVKSHAEFPLQEPVEFRPTVMTQSDVPGHTALQLALHCMSHVDVPAQLKLQPFVQLAVQSVPPAQTQVPASASHEQLPVHASMAVTSLPRPSTGASPGGVLVSRVASVGSVHSLRVAYRGRISLSWSSN